jgi:predicted extracellular nuclease
VENLFDYFDDPLTDDEAFTPQGEYHWTKERFNAKIRMIYKAIIAGCEGNFPDIIGLAEVENRWVLEQLIAKTPLKEVPYGIIHKESPDARGIDVALLFRKDRVIPMDFNFLSVSDRGKNAFNSRDILHFKGRIDRTAINFYVNHWPSRSEGYVESKEKRNLAAEVLRSNIDSLIRTEITPRILIMGDFNATPKEECLKKNLKANPFSNENKNFTLTNLSAGWLKHQEGTIYRAGQWEIFDQFICSQNMITGNMVQISTSDTRICSLPFLLEKDKNYPGKKPFRTYLGPAYHGGISDHLPIVTIIKAD